MKETTCVFSLAALALVGVGATLTSAAEVDFVSGRLDEKMAIW